VLFFEFLDRNGERFVELVPAPDDPAGRVHLWLLDREADGCSGFRSVDVDEALRLVRSGAALAYKW
jgi:hypothetical protein